MIRDLDRRLRRVESQIIDHSEDGVSDSKELICLNERTPEKRMRLRKALYLMLKTMHRPHAEIVVEDLKKHALNLYLWHFGDRFRQGGKTFWIHTPGELKLTRQILHTVLRWHCDHPLRMPQAISQYFLDHEEERNLSLFDPCYDCGFPHPNTETSEKSLFDKCALCGGKVRSFDDYLEYGLGLGGGWPFRKLVGVAPGYRWEDIDSVQVPDRLVYDFKPEQLN